MSNTKPVLAFFGATGGSTISAMVPALKAGYDCTALCRTPSKLTTMLRDRGVADSDIDTHLYITAGDVLNVDDVRSTLSLPDHRGGGVADIVISGIGINMKLSDIGGKTTLCEDAIRNILTALKQLQSAETQQQNKKPLLIALSTTGITSGKHTPRDLPVLMMPLYHLLSAPHEDKIRMEAAIAEHCASGDDDCVISGYILPRPSLLLDGQNKAGKKVRVGVEDRPAVGYGINRIDVGRWMFENLIEGDGKVMYRNQKPTLTL